MPTHEVHNLLAGSASDWEILDIEVFAVKIADAFDL